MIDDDPIFHLALPDDWAAAFTDGLYLISTRGMTLDEVGFIHCSTRDQIEDTANRFYGDVDQLVVLTIDPALVPSPIVREPPAPDRRHAVPAHLRAAPRCGRRPSSRVAAGTRDHVVVDIALEVLASPAVQLAT